MRDLVDIVLVTLLFFGISFLFRGAQAVALLRGTLFVLVGLILVSGVFQLQALQWLLQNSLFVLAVAIPVIFQPELRRALERLGRTRIFSEDVAAHEDTSQFIEEVCTAVDRLAERRHGALIVLERESSLDEFIRTGVAMDSYVSAALLLTVFWPKTDLHDGAVIVNRAGRVAAAAAVLPLSASRNMPQKKQGTRHRAALGITEVSDAICVVVSEETGRISVANAGRMIPRLDRKRLQNILNALYTPDEVASDGLWHRMSTSSRRIVQQLRTSYGDQ
ncbi:MAG: diadenylate cyclase CdaA [Chloroflexota bacterium]